LSLGLELCHQFLDAATRLVDRGARRCFLVLDRGDLRRHIRRGERVQLTPGTLALSDDAAHVIFELLDADALRLCGRCPGAQ